MRSQPDKQPPDPASDTPKTSTDVGDWLGDLVARVVDKLPPADTEVETTGREAAEQRRRRTMLQEFSRRVGQRYAAATLDTFHTTGKKQAAAVLDLKQYADHLPGRVAAGDGVLLCGPAGTGKDHLLVGLARVAIAQHGFQIGYAGGLDLFGRVRDSIGAGGSEAGVLGPLTRPRILILSDPLPPRGPVTDFQAAVLYRIIDERYRACRPTWVSMNVRSAGEADERLGAQAVDRLTDGALVIHCDWPSYRRARK